MKNIFKINLAMWGLQNAMTNMTDVHTCTVCSVHLLIAVVPVVDRQLFELSGDVVRSSGVHIPIGIHTVGGRSCSRRCLLRRTGEVGVVPFVAVVGRVAFDATHLAEDTGLEIAATATAAAAATPLGPRP